MPDRNEHSGPQLFIRGASPAPLAYIRLVLWLIAAGAALLASGIREMTTKLARAGAIASRVEFEAGPAANNPGPRAVLRQHAPSATRQRTLEANGIDRGAGPVLKAVERRRPRALPIVQSRWKSASGHAS